MELKTLKDFEGCDCGCCARSAIDPDELKAEAVKWVKDREARKKNKQYLDVQLAIFDEQLGWIKHFFNLTEKDLEEKPDD